MEIQDFLQITADFKPDLPLYLKDKPLGLLRQNELGLVCLTTKKPMTLTELTVKLRQYSPKTKLLYFFLFFPQYVFGITIKNDKLIIT